MKGSGLIMYIKINSYDATRKDSFPVIDVFKGMDYDTEIECMSIQAAEGKDILIPMDFEEYMHAVTVITNKIECGCTIVKLRNNAYYVSDYENFAEEYEALKWFFSEKQHLEII